MLFRVRWREDGEIHKVYAVQKNPILGTEFLIYIKGFDEPWKWVQPEECESAEE